MKKHLQEVEEILKALPAPLSPSKWKAEDYVGGGRSKLKFLDLKLPDIRNAFAQGFSFYTPDKKAKFNPAHLDTFEYIWNHSDSFEALLFCIFYIKSLPFSVRVDHRARLLKWLDRVDNWVLSDELSMIYSEFLEDDPALIKQYVKWNGSKNSWERRQSLVGVLFYTRFRKSKYLPWKSIKDLVDPLLEDEDYYVQKGVGWTLREAYNWYPEAVFKYIQNNVTKIDPGAWYACTEKMSLKEKAILKTLRRKRKSKRNSK
jgi:3-methyladenine DNA glycosylase AlkD